MTLYRKNMNSFKAALLMARPLKVWEVLGERRKRKDNKVT